MAWNGEVPRLGFEGERYVDRRNRVMHIPTPRGLGVIEVYAWSNNTVQNDYEGYNIFLPGLTAVAVKTPLEIQFIVHEFLKNGGNGVVER